MGDRYHLVQADLAEILQLVLSYHGADRQPQKFGRREPMFREKRHANVGGKIEVRSVRQVPVEIHRPPAGQELPGITLSSFFDHALPRALVFFSAIGADLFSPPQPPVGCMLRNRCGKRYSGLRRSGTRGKFSGQYTTRDGYGGLIAARQEMEWQRRRARRMTRRLRRSKPRPIHILTAMMAPA